MNQEYRLLWQLVGTIYTLATVAAGLATTVYFAVSSNSPSHAEFHELFFAALYAVGTAAIAALLWHARQSRLRAAQETGRDDDGDATTVDSLPDVAFIGHGFNVYLRIGLLVFLAGSVTLNLLRCTAQLFHAPASNCRRTAALLMNLLEIVFTSTQAGLILSHHRAVFLRRKAQSRMALSHLFTANICIWASSAIGEIKERLDSKVDAAAGQHNATATEAAISSDVAPAACEASSRVVEAARPFLTPAVIEYCLLAAPMVLHMLASVGDHRTFAERRQRSSLLADASASPAAGGAPRDCQAVLRRRFAKSRRGLAFCVAAFAVTAGVTVAVYQLLSGVAATIAYLVQDLLLSGLGVGLCLAVCRHMRRLGLAKCERHTFDDKLLMFALFGALVYQVTLMAVIVDHAEMFPRVYLSAELVSLVTCIVQLVLQTFCLLDGLRRRARSLADVEAKPGRCLVLALLGVNLSMWIMETFEVRKAEELLFSYSLSNVSDAALKIIIHVGQPINIFYRFHSTACLSIIWRKAYELHQHA